MADKIAPGVYVQETRGGAGAVQAVSASAFGIVGATPKGIPDAVTLVTSLSGYDEVFGLENTPMGLSALSFFQNGGSRLFVVRAVPSDAKKAHAYLGDTVTGEVTGAMADGTVGPFTFTVAKAPLVPGSLQVVVSPGAKATGTLTASGQPNDGDQVEIGGKTYTFQAALTDVDGNVLIGATVAESMVNLVAAITLGAGSGTAYAASTTAHPSVTATVAGSVVTAEALQEGLAGNTITTTVPTNVAGSLSWGSATLTGGADAEFAQDDGIGGFVGPDSGVIDYETGSVSVAFGTAPANGVGLVASYTEALLAFEMAYPGSYGNAIQVVLSGDPEFADDAHATWERFVLEVLDAQKGVTLEAFSGLNLTNAQDSNYLATVVGDAESGSKVLTVLDEVSRVPAALRGSGISGEAVPPVPAYDGATKQHTYTVAGGSVHPTTFKMTLSTGEVLTDDGNGGLLVSGGSNTLDASGTNAIDYATGVVTVTWATANAGAVTQSADYYTSPVGIMQDQMGGGADGSSLSRLDVSSPMLVASQRGLYAFNKEDSLMQITVPAFSTDETVMGDVIDYCEVRKDRFALVSVPYGLSPTEARNWTSRTLNKRSSYAACYYPHVQIQNPFTNGAQFIPAVSHVAGIMARVDNEKNVSAAPAGIPDASLAFATGLERAMSRADVETVVPARVNALVDWPQTGLAVWGAKTLESGGDFGYIQARRLFMFVEKAVFNSTHQHVFKNNGPSLWRTISLQISNYLTGLFRAGYFAGRSPSEAFFVVCDETNNPPSEVDAGRLHCDIGLAPTRPAEFVTFTLSRKLQG